MVEMTVHRGKRFVMVEVVFMYRSNALEDSLSEEVEDSARAVEEEGGASSVGSALMAVLKRGAETDKVDEAKRGAMWFSGVVG